MSAVQTTGDPRPYVFGVAAVALLALSAVAWTVPRPAADARSLVSLLIIVAGCFAFARVSVVARWREQRMDHHLVEGAVVVALALASPFLLPIGATAALLISIALTRKTAIKNAFNLAQGALASSTAALAATFVSAQFGAILGAALGLVVYSLVHDLAVAGLFARIERTSAFRVYRERLLLSTAISLTLGASLGFAFLGMWGIHPLASLLTIPLVAVAVEYSRLQMRAERELALHRRLADDAEALLGVADADRVAVVVLATANEALEASVIRLCIDERVHEIAYDAVNRGRRSIKVSVVGPSGRTLGSLEAWSRSGRSTLAESDRALLKHLAGWAAHAFESAAALRELDAQRALLARRERMTTLGTLVAGVAHEINNPLTYVSGNLEVVRMDLKEMKSGAPIDPMDANERLDSMMKALEAASRGADQIAHVVRSLRAAAQARADAKPEIVELNRLAEDIVTLVRAGLPMGVEISWKGAPSDPRVLGQPTDLHQALLNLTKNAAEAVATRGSGHVHLEVQDAGSLAEVVVSDDGPGMSPEVLDRLFTPFFTTKGASGTGLGLNIVAGIARAHHGEILAASEQGRGARFTLRLPIARALP